MRSKSIWGPLFVLFSASGCSPKLAGDWDGTLTFISVTFDVNVHDSPVHLHVTADDVTIVGAPFTTCTGKIKDPGKSMWIDFGGTCKFNGNQYLGKGKKAAVELSFPPDAGMGYADVKNGRLEGGYNPKPLNADGEGAPIFSFTAHR